jgi:hypothetical protein
LILLSIALPAHWAIGYQQPKKEAERKEEKALPGDRVRVAVRTRLD